MFRKSREHSTASQAHNNTYTPYTHPKKSSYNKNNQSNEK